MKQATLKDSLSFEGKGLHTGLMVHLRLHPAEVNTGIRICRVDLDGQPCYEALADLVSGTSRGTVLEKGKWKVSTVEHLMSALYGMGVTNCLVEVDAPEIPILDGSAKPYVDAIERVGVSEQDAEAKVFYVTEPIEFDNGKGSRMVLLPAVRYEAEVKIMFDSPILTEQSALLDDLALYKESISPARTFCFLREIELLLHLGLIKGGDMNNALVIYDKKMNQWLLNRLADKLGQPHLDNEQLGYLTPLKFDNEPARHKLLDLVGDMSLLGRRIIGHIYAERPGHGFNTHCCKELRKRL
ncbi:MAG: UDP-3-O-acyl-N-acetylglucosamine deacetylase [Paludibacteraceae bacterium]|nr:UDP-3-O-acyl-N-acetylglucosamine deacetylase [Paludibacteraceae bacterium]